MADYATSYELFQALKTAWSLESSSSWSPENPAKGQCSVTSLVMQDLFGGSILKTKTSGGTHFYNVIDGVKWDMTVSQLDRPIPFEDSPATREEAMADTSEPQYRALKGRLAQQLNSRST
ncbi:hypothetical protein CU102_22605 [Phyllobacterium brassicacearum]|uniref:YunG n=1 Tax=Phyllobacterium brassicacearum TaxID=314235 RepID=A0A2P7BBG4_9HYPH|nr:hypothetical protein [Phyllobacterium brassicacearum]PSH63815.1 hypothetical protein CU102_22605 [Phyllobacterium brassicacearum]TDQ20123.1 hypothetical protein DEV91_12383 [Phyllobacterium brassicacearum]